MPRITTVAIKHGRDTMAKNSDARICTGEQGMIVKKLCFVILLLSLPLLAKEYYAKVEPYEIRTVASNVSGIVVSADETLEGKRLDTAPFLRIDDEIDRVDLEKTRAKIVLLRRAVAHDEAMVGNYERIIAKKTENYEKVAALKMRSQVEKDREYYDLLATENQLMTIRKEMENLKVQINDHIAEEAGVSIGSLYQYFPDKEALIEGLLSRSSVAVRKKFKEAGEGMDFHQFPLKLVAEMAISYGIQYIKSDPLSREIVKNWYRLPIDKLLDPLENFFLVMAQPYFLKHYNNYPVEDLESKLYVLINSTIFTTMRYLLDDNTLIKEKELVTQLSNMIVLLLEDRK